MSDEQAQIFKEFGALVTQKLNEEALLCISYGQVPNFDSPEEALERATQIIAECTSTFVAAYTDTLTTELLKES